MRRLQVILSYRLPVSMSFKHLPRDFSITSHNMSLCFVVTRFFLESDLNLSCCHHKPLVHLVLASRETKNSCCGPAPVPSLFLLGYHLHASSS